MVSKCICRSAGKGASYGVDNSLSLYQKENNPAVMNVATLFVMRPVYGSIDAIFFAVL
jgi:hypothetical protein